MTTFPPSFHPHTLSIAHSTSPSLPPSSLFALVSSPHIASSGPSSSSTKPVLVFLHGYPQDHLLWAPLLLYLYATQKELWEQFRVVVPDLPGYGKSRKAVSPDGSHRAHSKREVGKDLLALVDGLFPVKEGDEKPKVVLIGHDRGARVAYRLAKDSPSRIVGLCVQDIIPTALQFSRMSLTNNTHAITLKSYHWVLLALPSPLPEMLLSSRSTRRWFIHHNLTAWSGSASRRLGALYPSFADGGIAKEEEEETTTFHPDAMKQWVEQYDDPAVLAGALEDYRAGATVDLADDAADASSPLGTTSPSPSAGDGGLAHGLLPPSTALLALWSAGLERGDLARPNAVRDTWVAIGGGAEAERDGRVRARRVMGGKGEGEVGHFLPLEAVEEVAEELGEWVGRWWGGRE
ncbi:hypothetical protein JCM6882_000407 [Rhodosporidiobolus microsporus]